MSDDRCRGDEDINGDGDDGEEDKHEPVRLMPMKIHLSFQFCERHYPASILHNLQV